jgi:hypothetical protein
MSLATLKVKVINASYEDLGPTTLAGAIKLVEVQKRAEIIEVDESRIYITASGEPFLIPKVIRMLEMLKVPFHYGPEYFSKQGVLKRDNHTCGYCGKTSAQGVTLTHDHILPKSRGGADSWENAIAACVKCNGKKADRTPEEANMPLLFQPTVPMRIYLRSDKPRRARKKDR